jgi:hypothetical protein
MSKKSRSKLWFLVHSRLALPIWFFVLIVCVTGTLAVVSQEISGWPTRPCAPASPRTMHHGSTTTKLSPPSRPSPTLIESISRPDESHFALDVEVSYPDGRSATVCQSLHRHHSGHGPDLRLQGLYPSPAWLVAGAVHQWLQLGLVPGVVPQPADAGVLVTGLVVYKRF